MSLTIEKIEFTDFRSYQRFSLKHLSALVIIVGDNAVGKTNIIEGLQLLTAMESFRHPQWKEVVRKEASSCKIELDFFSEGRTLEICMKVVEGRRSYLLNGKNIQRTALLGLLPSVLFTPDDLQLIKGSSAQRREMIDGLGSQISPAFETIRQDYSRVLQQKKQLLKTATADPLVLASWNANLAKLGAALYIHRRRLLSRLLKETMRIYQQLAPNEQLTAEYVPSWQRFIGEDQMDRQPLLEDEDKETIQEYLEQAQTQVQAAERLQQRCLIGPHRDEIRLYINGNDSRHFASQGQQRSLALALRIASISILHEVLNKQPILLLDDVMSELDKKRREVLLEIISAAGQTFITTTNLGYFSREIIEHAQVIELEA
jgi:DNA replication and repair protein RecF